MLLLRACYSLHTTVGLVGSSLLLGFSFFAMVGFKRQNVAKFGNKISSSGLYIFCLFLGTAVLGAIGFAGLSYGLEAVGKSEFVESQSLTLWRLAEHYLWQLVDMLPGIKAWETLKVADPSLPNDFWSRLTVVLFRAFIVVPFLGLLQSLLRLSIEDEETRRASGDAA